MMSSLDKDMRLKRIELLSGITSWFNLEAKSES